MSRFEKLKAEIAEMSVEEFTNKFIAGNNNKMKEYICGDINHPHAHCTKNDDYDCLRCINEYLESEV